MTNILLCLSHSIEEHDQLKLLSGLGYAVASIGGYIDPRHPHDPKRPALDIDVIPEIKAAVDGLGTSDNLGAAQSNLPPAVLDWADVIIYHHYLPRLYGQWPTIRRWLDGRSNRRVLWRTVGQSVEGNEREAQPFHDDGLEIVRYSPKERNIPGFAGEDALIRFYKDPAEWSGWNGEDQVVLNISQHHEEPHSRDEFLNWGFWEKATDGLPAVFAGPHTEKIGGLGQLSLDDMKALLRRSRVYLYTGTQPASYTLGLIEAMMTGIPVVSIGPSWMKVFPYGPELFEGHEIAGVYGADPGVARLLLNDLLNNAPLADTGQGCLDYLAPLVRQRAVGLFGIETVGAAWKAFLG